MTSNINLRRLQMYVDQGNVMAIDGDADVLGVVLHGVPDHLERVAAQQAHALAASAWRQQLVGIALLHLRRERSRNERR